MTLQRQRRALMAAAVLASAMRAARTAPSPRRLGVLMLNRAESWQFLREELPKALAPLGWIAADGPARNLQIDWRFADDDPSRLPALAQALVRDGAEVLLTRGTPATRALSAATTTVPIVTGVGDPVGAGLATSLAAPGGNITGLSYAFVDTTRKQIELLREMGPGMTRLLLVLPATRASIMADSLRTVERIARAQKLQPQVVVAKELKLLRQALQELRGSGGAAAFVFSFAADATPKDVARVLLQVELPSVFDQRGYVAAGGLMSYRLYWDNQTQHTAAQIDKLLRGAKAAEIPFEQPTRSELVLNAGTAKLLKLRIPAALLARADEVIQ